MLKEEIRKLIIGLRRQTNNNSLQNHNHNLIPLDQPTYFTCNKTGNLVRHCKQEYQDLRILQNKTRNIGTGKTLLNNYNGKTTETGHHEILITGHKHEQ